MSTILDNQCIFVLSVSLDLRPYYERVQVLKRFYNFFICLWNVYLVYRWLISIKVKGSHTDMLFQLNSLNCVSFLPICKLFIKNPLSLQSTVNFLLLLLIIKHVIFTRCQNIRPSVHIQYLTPSQWLKLFIFLMFSIRT